MPNYEVSFLYKETVHGYEVLPADSLEHAENEATKTIREFYPEAEDIEIVEVKEVNG